MNVYTDVYNKSVEVLKTPSLAEGWKPLEAELKALLQAEGPSAANAKALDNLRKRLRTEAKGKPQADVAKADAIVEASKPDTHGFQDRAALLKSLVHTYHIHKKGAQSIWVVDPPAAYGKWAFDEFAGKSAIEIQAALKSEAEVFGSDHRKMMSDAAQLARKWSADVQARLGKPDKKLKETVRRWFHAAGDGDADVDKSIATLLAGFKLVHGACNSTRIIFSDRPHLRVSGEWDNVYASVNDLDAMPVIYIYQVFLTTGKRNVFGHIPKLWLCALTVIHELTHKLVKTKDIRYDDDGLKPGAGFSSAEALNNADSWAYFAADVVGALRKATLDKVLV